MEPQKSIVLPVALAVLISAVVFGAGGYYLANNQNTTDTTTATPTYTTQTTTTIKPTTTPTTTTSATAETSTSSKTYSSNQFGFSLKYANGWNVNESTVENYGDGSKGQTIVFYKGSSKDTAPKLTITVNPPGSGVPVPEISYKVTYQNGVFNIGERSKGSAEMYGDTPIEPTKGHMRFDDPNSDGINIPAGKDTYAISGSNITTTDDENDIVEILKSFKKS